MQMLHQLIAVGEVDAALRNRNARTVRDNKFYVIRQLNLPGNLMGHIDRVDLSHKFGDFNCQRTIAWSNFQVSGIGAQMPSEEGQPMIEVVPNSGGLGLE